MITSGSQKNIEQQIKKICTLKGPLKRKFMDGWRSIWKESYANIGQYGFCGRNGMEGVLTPKGNWSPVNQFNTNYTINIKIVEKLNEWIYQDFFLKGLNNFNGELISEITFEDDKIDKEIENYFSWVRYYNDKILIDQRVMSSKDFLYELFEISSRTMGIGTYAEICIEYHFKKHITSTNIYRTSAIRGSLDDMVNGCDLFTINKTDKTKIKKIQTKVVKFFENNFKNLIDVNDYLEKEIDFLILASMNYDYRFNTISPDEIIVLNLNNETIIEKPNNWFTYNTKNVVMKEKIDEIFNSQIFFEFFVYCTKNDIEFLLEVSDETNFDYNKEERKLNAHLPSGSENFDNDKIYDIWSKIIENISKSEEDRNTMMLTLNKLFKK